MGSLLRIEEMTGLSLLLIPLMLLVQTQGKHLLIETGEAGHKPAKAKANTTDYRIINKGTFMNDFTQIDNRCKKNNITYFINEENAEVKGMVKQTGGCNPGNGKKVKKHGAGKVEDYPGVKDDDEDNVEEEVKEEEEEGKDEEEDKDAQDEEEETTLKTEADIYYNYD